MDSTEERVDKPPKNASMRPPLHHERASHLRIWADATSHSNRPGSPSEMELQIDTEKLVRRLADALREREEQLLSELAARTIGELSRTSDRTSAVDQRDDVEIKGIELHALYSVSFVADRWKVSADNVRKKSEEELPRSDWKGGEIRYRGIDILRYEGVEIDEQLDGSPSRARDSRGSRSTESPQAKGRPSLPNGESGDGRPYNGDLPELSDEGSSQD